MKIKFTSLLVILISLVLHAQDKLKFDFDQLKLNKLSSANSQMAANFEVKNDRISMTIISGGYFTLGTTSGLSQSNLDDNCQLTFGHPYAMTSYPVFSIDGTWYKLQDYFSNPADIVTGKNGDTLKVTAAKEGFLSISFLLYYQQSDQSIKLSFKVKNLDSKNHNIGLGLMYDPALGKNGDGSLALSGAFLKDSKVFSSSEIMPEQLIWEKSYGAKGLGTVLKFSEVPTKMIAGNWNDTYSTIAPDQDNIAIQRLYDLYLKIYWAESSITPGNEKEEVTSVSLVNADFSSSAFLRWDLPGYLAIDNNIMFPQSMTTYLQISKTGTGSINNGNLKLELPVEVTSGTLSYIYGSSTPSFQKIDLTAKTLYENKVIELTAKLFDGASIIDEIHRYLLIPETPVSDTGLVVTIDTLITTKYPAVNLTFEVLNKSKGTKIPNLLADNIFLFENNSRLQDYTFGKDTSGGSTATDIVFALDVTGSMGNEIDAVKKNIVEFADSLTKSGISYQLGLVTFLDNIEHIYPFTKDAQYFQQLVAQQFAHGGDDLPENSLQALLEASRFNFRSNSKRIVIWITDASYHENDSFTKLIKKTVTDSLLVKGIIVHAIGEQQYKSSYYDPIVLATGGNYYDITGNFRDILLDISRVKNAYKYMISYRSPAAQQGGNQIKLQIRYAGLGGAATVSYNTGNAQKSEKYFSFYPNPFNPEINFKVRIGEYRVGKLRIYDILGRVVKEFNLSGNNLQNVVWNARNENGGIVGTGFYIAELTLTDANKNSHIETAKILYLK